MLATLRAASLAVIAAVSVAVSSPQAAVAATPTVGSLTTSASRVLAGATVKVAGKLPPRAARPVVLQRYTAGSWARLASKKSTRSGTFAFSTRVPSKPGTVAQYRVYAPRARVAGKFARASVTPVRSVRVLAPTAPPAPGTRLNPYPSGTSFGLGSWNFRLATSDTDAWPEIAATNMFNDPPRAGWSYITVPVTFTYLGSGSERPWLSTTIDFLGSDNVVYNDFSDQSCGVVPNDVTDINDLYPGGSATGNECAVVPTSAVEGGKWRVRTDFTDAERFVAIR